MPFCSNCGGSIQNLANFCVKCGAPTKSSGDIASSTAVAIPKGPNESTVEIAAPSKRESSELKNLKAVIYVGVLIVFYVVSALYFSDSPAAARINGAIFKAQLSAAVVAWVISKMLPDGWLTTQS